MTAAFDLFEFAEAKALRDNGMAMASAAQGPRWAEIAYAAIERVARRQVLVHVDDVIAENVPTPTSHNAWGAVWLRAIRAEVIQRTNQVRPCTMDRRKHAHLYPVYISRIYDPRCTP